MKRKLIIDFYVLMFLATPVPFTTQQQTLLTCVGDTVFLPSYFPVSAFANDVEVTWFRNGTSVVPADNGIVTDNYSYEVNSVIMSDAGQYVARVTVPNQDGVEGPTIQLTVRTKPGEFPVLVTKCTLCMYLGNVHFYSANA